MHYLVDGTIPDVAVAEDKCWKGYSNYPYIWILAGPMTAALFVSNTNLLSTFIYHVILDEIYSLFFTPIHLITVVINKPTKFITVSVSRRDNNT
jgi:hypothetical protein